MRGGGRLAVGLMSGTSADGVTAALVSVGPGDVKVLRWCTLPYPKALRLRVLGAAGLTTPELSRLNMELGESFARAALAVMRGERSRKRSVGEHVRPSGGGQRPEVIGSHGQTVWHGPEDAPANTLQIAEPAVIAERTCLPVAADFRPRDMAAGGQGAPLVPAFDEFLFARGPLRALLNIGGIGNVSVAGRGRLWSGFDTGPGNCLMDLAAREATHSRLTMDRDGRLAARGRPDSRIVDALMADAYFARRPPKSLDRSAFGTRLLRRRFGRLHPAALPDVMATLALFTARSIHESFRRFILPRHRLKEVIVSGGGALNPALMRFLTLLLSPLPVTTSDRHGIPMMAKEAACFAWMALRVLDGLPNSCPAATGARGRRVLGVLLR